MAMFIVESKIRSLASAIPTVAGEFFGTKSHVYLKAPNDLSQVTLKIANRSGEQQIILKPMEVNSANSIVFKSDDGAYRAIYLYSNNDLSLLARIYFVSENTLMEFWSN